MSESELNPYASPTVPSESGKTTITERAHRIGPWLIGWVVVYLLNLIVPAMLGADQIRDDAAIGVLSAVLLLLAFGCLLCVYRPRTAAILTYGGVVVGASQVFPALHVIAGLIALLVVEGFRPGVARVSFESGFGLTFVTGVVLLLAAGGIGSVLQLFLPTSWLPPVKQPGKGN